MNGSKFKVLLYSDKSQYAFFAAVYAAILMMNMPNMHLTVVQLKESVEGSIKTESDCHNSWPISPTSDWMKEVIERVDSNTKTRHLEMLAKANELFSIRAVDIHHQVLYCNPNIPDTVEALLDYGRKKSIELIVIGTGELRTLKGLIFGSLAHTVQNKSPIPVLLVKDLPQDLVESYRSKPVLKLIRK